MISVQDVIFDDLLQEEGANESTEMVQLFQFMKNEAVPLNENQNKALLLLSENGLGDIASMVLNMRSYALPVDQYHTTLNKLTLADRIKGNAKLSHLLKANANPVNGLTPVNPKDYKAQGLKQSELGG